MRLFVAFLIVFIIIVIFAEFLPQRTEIIEMYSRLNDIVRSSGENINLDIFESLNGKSRAEFKDTGNAVLYLERSDKSKMTKDSIDLIARVFASGQISPESETIRYISAKEKMTNYAVMSGKI